MNGRMSIHDVVEVSTSISTGPAFKARDIFIKTRDGSVFELTIFCDDLSKVEIKHANEG